MMKRGVIGKWVVLIILNDKKNFKDFNLVVVVL